MTNQNHQLTLALSARQARAPYCLTGRKNGSAVTLISSSTSLVFKPTDKVVIAVPAMLYAKMLGPNDLPEVIDVPLISTLIGYPPSEVLLEA